MVVLCGMPTVQYSAQSAWLSVRLSKWPCPKVIWHKVHRCLRRMVQCYSTGDGNVSFHKGTLAPPGEYDWTCASFRPTRVHSRNGKWIGSAVFAQLMKESAYTLQWAPLSTRIAPSRGGSGPPICNTWCFQPMRVHIPNGTSIGSVVFAQMTAECLRTLQWFVCFPLRIAPTHVGIWTFI